MITDVRVKKVEGESKLKANVSVTFGEVFVVHDFKVIEGKDGLIGSGTTIEDAIQDLKEAEPLWEEYVKEIEESKNKEG